MLCPCPASATISCSSALSAPCPKGRLSFAISLATRKSTTRVFSCRTEFLLCFSRRTEISHRASRGNDGCLDFFLLRLIQRQRFPQGIDPFLCRFVHQYLIRPRPRKSFRRPLPRRIDPHLRSDVRHPRRVIQRIHRAQRKLHVPLRIQRAQRLPNHLAVVMHIHVVVHHHNPLGKHRLPQRPNRIHDLARVPGIRLSNL